MASLYPRDNIPINIENLSDSGDAHIFEEYDCSTINHNLLSLCDSLQSTVHTSPSLNALCVEPDTKQQEGKRHSIGGTNPDKEKSARSPHNLLYKVRDDFDVICAKFKQSREKLKRSLSSLRTKWQSTWKSEEPKPRIKVEYIEGGSTDYLWPHMDSPDNEDMLDYPDHNYSPSLIITDLSDGCFSAQIPLKALPRGELTIRIRNYKMEIVVGRRPSLVADNHRIINPIKYGDINIPIYVNPSTLLFDLDEAEKMLCIFGYTKGYQGLRKTSLGYQQKKKYSLPILSLKDHSDIYLTNQNDEFAVQNKSPKRSLTVSYSESFRQRALSH